jgi:hypothetical protein
VGLGQQARLEPHTDFDINRLHPDGVAKHRPGASPRIPDKFAPNATEHCSVTFDSDAWVHFGRGSKQRETELVTMHAHVDDRVLAEMSAEGRLDRIGRIIEALEARDEPRFSFVDHEHEQGLSNTR